MNKNLETYINSTPLSFQESINRAFAKMQKEVLQTNIQILGQKVFTFCITSVRDKYDNSFIGIQNYKPITVLINFPGNEIPTPIEGETNKGSQVLHLYDILPMIGWFKADDNIKLHDIILFKIKLYNQVDYQVVPLEVVDFVSKGTTSNIVYQEANLASPTNFQLGTIEEYKRIIQEFKTIDTW